MTEISKAQQYRYLPSGEIERDLKDLEKLRQRVLKSQSASWEWDREAYTFRVSKQWSELTGYKPEDTFPQNLSKAVPIERLLDEMVEAWLAHVSDRDRPRATPKVRRFLLFNNVSSHIQHEYHMRCADGSEKFVCTIARSVWKDGLLMAIVSQTIDLSGIETSADRAIALKEQKTELVESKKDIKAIAARTGQIEGVIKLLLAVIPAVSALVVVSSEALEEIGRAVKIDLSLLRNRPSVVEAADLGLMGSGLKSLNELEIDRIKSLMERATPLGDRVKFAAYEPGVAPTQYRILIRAEQNSMLADTETTALRSTSHSPFESGRTRSHLSGEPFTYTGGTYQYSVPFKIVWGNKEETFFVAIDATSPDEDTAANIQASLRQMSTEIKSILSGALLRESND